jgi:RNA polymerase sigma-70 factor, ECF subfamily
VSVKELYEELRPLMFSIAYRMVGSASDAEDIVQEAFLRFHRESGKGTAIDSPKAYLSAITTRLSIDHLRSARVRRERYFGTWLQEPVLTDPGSDVAQHAETAYGRPPTTCPWPRLRWRLVAAVRLARSKRQSS